MLNGSLVEDLRTTVDYLSQFLWSYIEFAAEESGPDADYATRQRQNERLLRITEMLRMLHRSSCPTQDPMAFVDRITKSVDHHLETANQDDLLCESRIGDAKSCATSEGPRQEKNGTRGPSGGWFLSSSR